MPQMFLVEINATTPLSWQSSFTSDVNSGLSQAFHGELCYPPKGVQPIPACLPATGNLGLFYLSLQLLTSTSGCWSVKRKTNEQQQKAPTICFTSLIPEKSYQSIFVSAIETTLFVGIMPGSTTVRNQNPKFHSTFTDHRHK